MKSLIGKIMSYKRMILYVLGTIGVVTCILVYWVIHKGTMIELKEFVKQEDFKNAFVLNSSPTFQGYYYQGSDEKFHYFIAKWQMQKDKQFKISAKDLNIKPDYTFYLHKKKDIRIRLFKTDNSIVFAESKYGQIFYKDAVFE